jgi:hypothetical protein
MMTLMGSHRVMARIKDKYLAVIQMHRESILVVYLLHEKKKPVMLFDVTEVKV